MRKESKDRARLAEYLRTRRESQHPTEDVGLPCGRRRRTKGLRREEVAVLSDMSIDYYTRLEQPRGPRPSTPGSRSWHYRWFTDPATRMVHPSEDRDDEFRVIAADLLSAYTREGKDSRAGVIVEALLAAGPEFAALWRDHPVAARYCGPRRLRRPRVGLLELNCRRLLDPDQSQQLVVYTAIPGTESHEKLQLLSVIGGLDVTEPAAVRS